MDAVLVRPFRPADHSAVAGLFAGAGRQPASPVFPRGCCVAVAGGQAERVIGFGSWWHVRLDKFRMDLLVAPEARRQGAGTLLLDHLLSAGRDAGAATVQARVASEDQEPLDFLLARGFVETMRMHRQLLQVAEANLAEYAHLPARLAERGIVLASLTHEVARGKSFWEEFCQLYNTARDGWPDPDPDPNPRTPLTPAEIRRRHQAAAKEHGIGAEQCFLAVYADRYVGFTGALGTAVDPAFRQQGIATALKLRAVISARDHGLATLDTSTGNPAMLRANERLGYRVVSTEIRLVKTLQAPRHAH